MNDPFDFPPAMIPARADQPRLAADEFIARDDLDGLVAAGEVRLQGAIARTTTGGVFVLREAVRVLGNISHETDPYGFTGQVDTVGAFLRRGFVMSGERIALGRSVYDVEYGFLVQLVSGGADRSGINTAL